MFLLKKKKWGGGGKKALLLLTWPKYMIASACGKPLQLDQSPEHIYLWLTAVVSRWINGLSLWSMAEANHGEMQLLACIYLSDGTLCSRTQIQTRDGGV